MQYNACQCQLPVLKFMLGQSQILEQLRELGRLSLEKRKLREDLPTLCINLKRGYSQVGLGLYPRKQVTGH